MAWKAALLFMIFYLCPSNMEEKAVLSLLGGKIRTSAGKDDKREKKQCWEVEWGEIQFRWTRELAKTEVGGKAAGVRYVAEEKGGWDWLNKENWEQWMEWHGLEYRLGPLGCRCMSWVDEHNVAWAKEDRQGWKHFGGIWRQYWAIYLRLSSNPEFLNFIGCLVTGRSFLCYPVSIISTLSQFF